MDELVKWFHRQAERDKHIVVLQDAILDNRFWAYAFYRLRFFIFRFLAESLIHLIRVMLLFYIFTQNEFISVVLIHVAFGLLSSFWWGSLEVMRGRVRQLYRFGKFHMIPKEIRLWLSHSIHLSIATVVAGFAWTGLWFWCVKRTFSVVDLYVLSLFLQLSLSFVTRCYHSGIFAIRRIFRPLSMILLVEILGFAGILVLWPWLGPWSFPIASIISTLVSSVVTFYYTTKLYHFFDFEPSGSLTVKRLRIPFRDSIREWLSSGLSNIVMSIDSLLILVLFTASTLIGVSSATIREVTFFTLFFIMGPAIRAGIDWTRLFYFDLKLLEIKPFKNLRHWFERSVLRLAWLLAFVFWAFASIIATLAYQKNLDELYWFLVPFFLSRSLLAATQMQAFSENSYAEVLKSGVLFIVSLVPVNLLFYNANEQIIAFSVIMFSAFGLLLRRQEAVRRDAEIRQVISPNEWITRVKNIKMSIRISVVRTSVRQDKVPKGSMKQVKGEDAAWKHRQIAEKITASLSQQIAEKISGRLRSSGRVTFLYPNFIAWYELADVPERISEDWLFIQLSGLVEALDRTGAKPNGIAALEEACVRKFLGDDLYKAWNSRRKRISMTEVKRAFEQMFPDGIVFEPSKPIHPLLHAITSRERRIILYEAATFARDFRIGTRRSNFFVTAFCPEGELRLIFLIDKRTDRKLFYHWSILIKKFNLHAAISSLTKDE